MVEAKGNVEPVTVENEEIRMNELIRNFVSLWRKEADGILEIRELTLYEQSVWESVNLMGSAKDDDQYSSGMVMEALGAEPARLWFENRIQELVKDGFIAVKNPTYEPTQ
jgi:hypothetical protein